MSESMTTLAGNLKSGRRKDSPDFAESPISPLSGCHDELDLSDDAGDNYPFITCRPRKAFVVAVAAPVAISTANYSKLSDLPGEYPDPKLGDGTETPHPDVASQESPGPICQSQVALAPALDLEQRREVFHCGQCRQTFMSRTSCRTHRRMKACSSTNNPHELRFCSIEHEHEPIELQFDSMDDALKWRIENELDRYFSFTTIKTTKGIKGAYRVLQCTQNVKSKLAGTKKTKKIFDCPAKITFNQRQTCLCPDHQSDWCDTARQQVLVYGCLKHSHDFRHETFRDIRLSKIMKEETADLLKAGIRSDVVIDKYLSMNDQAVDIKPVTYSDVYRIKKSCNLEGYDEHTSEVINVLNILHDESFHGFNFGRKFDMSMTPESIGFKVTQTSGYFLLTYASPEMIHRFNDHPNVISIDGTHGTNAAKYILISIMIFDCRGEGSPVFQALVENENKVVFSAALESLKSIAPEACAKVKVLLSDTSHTFINSWRDVINPNVIWSVCHWHLEKSWTRKIKNSKMLEDIKSLRHLAELGPFTQKLQSIQSKWEASEESAAWAYFIGNYGPEGRQAPMNAWARPATLGCPPHNLHVERYHGSIKNEFKPSMNIPRFSLGLKRINKIFIRKDLMAKEGIRGVGQSKIQSDMNKSHPSEAEIASYSLKRIDDNWIIINKSSPTGETITYSMKKNRFVCNTELCQVRCERCPKGKLCAHEYTCTCPRYAYRNLCKHIRVLALMDSPQDNTKDIGSEERIESEVLIEPEELIESEERIESEGVLAFLTDCFKVKKKIQGLEEVLMANDLTVVEKKKLIDGFRAPFANILNTPNNLHPSSFPRLDRKRVHERQNRSFFPDKTAKRN